MSRTLVPSQSVTDRDSKGNKFMSIVAAAYNRAALSDDEARRVNEVLSLSNLNKEGNLPEMVTRFINRHRKMDLFKDDEVKSDYIYRSGYTVPKPITEQVKILCDFFPQLGSSDADEIFTQVNLPAGAEGFFAVPRWEKIAPTYVEAVLIAIDAISKVYRGKIQIDDDLDLKNLRQYPKTAEAFHALEKVQKGRNILIFPGQFGSHHLGRTVRRAREVMNEQEFGLGLFAVGSMLLTHPERLQDYDDPRINCAGDELLLSTSAAGIFGRAPYLTYSSGKCWIRNGYIGPPAAQETTASAFLPQDQHLNLLTS